jgi:hypothetical protein
MNHTQDMIENARKVLTGVQAEVFFDKLASLGINPQNDSQADQLWDLGAGIVAQSPRVSDAGQRVKQASVEMFGSKAVLYGSDGYSQEARDLTDRICQNSEVIKAAHFLIAAQNV